METRKYLTLTDHLSGDFLGIIRDYLQGEPDDEVFLREFEMFTASIHPMFAEVDRVYLLISAVKCNRGCLVEAMLKYEFIVMHQAQIMLDIVTTYLNPDNHTNSNMVSLLLERINVFAIDRLDNLVADSLSGLYGGEIKRLFLQSARERMYLTR